jgi:signal peptidase I
MADTNARTAASAITSDSSLRATASRGEPWTIRTLLIGPHPRRTVLRAAALIVAAYILFGHVLIPVRGEGPSMQPTVRNGQLVFVNRAAYWRSDPSRGDIVAISLAGRRVLYVKRIVGMPGDRVRIAAGTVYVNDAALDEPYVERRRRWNVPETRLADDEYLMIGDNRSMPMWQHDFGKARRERIVGQVVRLP